MLFGVIPAKVGVALLTGNKNNNYYNRMKNIITILIIAFTCIQVNAQVVRLGVEIAPSFKVNPSRFVKPAINLTAQVGTETVLAHVGINSTQLEIGTYFGVKCFKFGVFARVDILQNIQLTPVMAIRYTHEVKNGLLLEIGAKAEVPTRTDRVYTYTPVYIAVQKNLIEDENK